MFQNFFSKAKDKMVEKLIDKQLKNVPEDQKQMIKTMVAKDPELFQKIAQEIKEKQKSGMNDMHASMQVMMKYKDQIQRLMQQ